MSVAGTLLMVEHLFFIPVHPLFSIKLNSDTRELSFPYAIHRRNNNKMNAFMKSTSQSIFQIN